jgi:hypothetical protein
MSACGAPEGARRDPAKIADTIGFALFGAPSPQSRGTLIELRTLGSVAERTIRVLLRKTLGTIFPGETGDPCSG